MNREIQATNDNSRILAEYVAAQVSLARKKKYGCYFEFTIPNAQDLIDSAEDVYK